MKIRTFAITAALAALAALPASATVLYSTGFEAPTFTTGALAGQGGWSLSTFTSGQATVENTFVHDGAQAVEFDGFGGGAYYADPITPTEPIVVSMDVYYGSGAGFLFQLTVGSSPGFSDITAGVNLSNTNVSAITSSFPMIDAISQNAWHNFALTLDYATQTYDVSIDGSRVASNLAFCGGMANSITCLGQHASQFGDLELFVHSKDGANYLDDVSISAVPEPAAWALMLAGFAGLGGALRSRRKAAVA